MTISQMILLDFTQYMDKFVAIQPPRPNDLADKKVKDEDENYNINIKLFNDISIFLKGCHEVYCILTKQVEDMILKPKEFYHLYQYITRARMNVSSLIATSKLNENNYNFDNNVIDCNIC